MHCSSWTTTSRPARPRRCSASSCRAIPSGVRRSPRPGWVCWKPASTRAWPRRSECAYRASTSPATSARPVTSPCCSKIYPPAAVRSPTERVASRPTRPPARWKTWRDCTCASRIPRDAAPKQAGCPSRDRPATTARRACGFALDQHRERIGDLFAELSELYIEKNEDPARALARGSGAADGRPRRRAHRQPVPTTPGRTGFLDWGIICASTPLRDVSYFLCMALSVEDRRARERDLLRYYLGSARGGRRRRDPLRAGVDGPSPAGRLPCTGLLPGGDLS